MSDNRGGGCETVVGLLIIGFLVAIGFGLKVANALIANPVFLILLILQFGVVPLAFPFVIFYSIRLLVVSISFVSYEIRGVPALERERQLSFHNIFGSKESPDSFHLGLMWLGGLILMMLINNHIWDGIFFIRNFSLDIR